MNEATLLIGQGGRPTTIRPSHHDRVSSTCNDRSLLQVHGIVNGYWRGISTTTLLAHTFPSSSGDGKAMSHPDVLTRFELTRFEHGLLLDNVLKGCTHLLR